MKGDWREAMRKRISKLPGKEEGELVSRLESSGALPFAATSYWLSLASEDFRHCLRSDRGVPSDPILGPGIALAGRT